MVPPPLEDSAGGLVIHLKGNMRPVKKMKIYAPRRQWLMCWFVAAAVFGGCGGNTGTPRTEAVQDREPDQMFLKSRIVITENGLTGAVVEAESVSVELDKRYTAIGGGIKLDLYNKNGEHTSTLTAKHGDMWGLFEAVDSLKASGDVVVVSNDGTKRLETASGLCWVAETRMVYADGLVKLTSEEAVEQGINFVAKDDLSEYRMDNVSGRFEGTGIKPPGRKER